MLFVKVVLASQRLMGREKVVTRISCPRVGYNLTLDYLNKHLAEIPRTRTVYLHCGSGYRAIVQTDVPTSQNRYDKGYSGILKKNGRTLAGNLKFYAHGKTCRVKLTTEIKIEV